MKRSLHILRQETMTRFGGPVEDSHVKEPPLRISGDVDRYDHHVGNDDYSQPGSLFRLLPADEKERLFSNIAAALQGVPDFIVTRQLEHFAKADPAYGEGVAKAIHRLTRNEH